MEHTTKDEPMHTHVGDRVIVHRLPRRDIAYMSPDKATWSDLQIALHEACQAGYIMFANLENAWYLSGKKDQALSDQSLAVYAAWQTTERLARPYFPNL